MNNTPAITVQHLTVLYGATPVLDDISVAIPGGVICAIIGPNGAGKSTFMNALVGLVKPLSGVITIGGLPAPQGRSQVAYVPQRSSVDWHFPISVYDVVMMGRYPAHGFWGRVTKKDHRIVKEALQMVGMLPYAQALIGELSGGQQQRVFLARALAQERPILMLDEPYTGLDAVTESIYTTVLQALRTQGCTILLVHHDLAAVASYADWAILLRTKLIASGPCGQVTTEPHLIDAYGRPVLGARGMANV